MDNTLCLPADDPCPITKIRFVTESQKASLGNAFKYAAFTQQGKYLAYGTDGDNLPMTTFAIGPRPCLNSNLSPVASKANLYPIEFDALTDYCPD
jgi:hypothetical protein